MSAEGAHTVTGEEMSPVAIDGAEGAHTVTGEEMSPVAIDGADRKEARAT